LTISEIFKSIISLRLKPLIKSPVTKTALPRNTQINIAEISNIAFFNIENQYMSATKLSVNINKVALIRNSRGSNLPDVLKFARDCEEFGADGITVHPRPDERHIRYSDLQGLKDQNTTEFNIEGYPSQDFIDKVVAVVPDQVTLVPDPPGVLTSNQGWDIGLHKEFLIDTISKFKEFGIRVSLFIEPDPSIIALAKAVQADRVELYTGHYADEFLQNRQRAVEAYSKTAQEAFDAGIGLNAGHDLNLDNLRFFKENVIGLKEVSIGHALISDALYYGISNVIKMYKNELSFR